MGRNLIPVEMTSAPTWACSNAVSMPTVATLCSCNVLLVKPARCGGDAGRALRLGTEPSRDRSNRGSDRGGQTACKPGSVPACAGDGHSSGTPVTGRLARPTRAAARKPAWSSQSCDRVGLPSLLGLAPGGVYPATPVAGGAVRSYRTLSPLPAFAPEGLRAGGLLSVALSLGSPPPGVTRHRVSVEPGLSSPRKR